ncbi:MAG: TonB-dependent receptor [Gammaproteobacteria bacterium]|nr:TonB-dependent receptor [Gammaproteobacteria bacterium]
MSRFLRGRRGAPDLLLALLLIWLCAPVAAASEETDSDQETEEGLRPMETVMVLATRTEESLLDATEAVSVIQPDDIARLAPEMIAEMMRGVPGAFFQQTTPGQGIPIIRGLKGSQILHLVDGMRLNNAFFRNAPNQYLGLVDAYATERAEVVRGSAPSLYGADAMGGVLQILTREPEFRGTEWERNAHIYGSFNSVDNSVIARTEAATGKAGSVVSGGLTYQHHGDRTVGGGDTIEPSGYRVQAADFKWRQDLGERADLMLSAQYVEQPETPRIDELVPGFGQENPSSEQYLFFPNRRDFLHARFRLESSSRWFERFEAHLGRQVITDDRQTQDFGATEIRREFNESTLDGLTLQFNSPWGDGRAGSREFIWGFEYYTDAIDSSRFLRDTVTGNRREVRSRFPDGSGMDSMAVYAAHHWHWDRLSLEAGLRYSRFEITLPPTDEFDEVRLEPDDLTGDLHFGYELSPGLRLVGNVGRGFRPPNIFDLGTLGSRPGNRFNVPNPDLEPESVWSYDLGIKYSSDAWQLEVYGWYLDYRDKISSRFTGEVTPEGRQVVQSDNLNEATLYGIESGLRYYHGDIEYYAVVNYTRGEEDDDGVTVPADRVPPLNGRLGLVYRPRDTLRIEPYLDFASRQDRLSPRDVDDPRINPLGTAGWGTLNLLLSWQATDAAELGLRLQNLGDKNYREHGSGIDAPGRNLGLWMSLHF